MPFVFNPTNGRVEWQDPIRGGSAAAQSGTQAGSGGIQGLLGKLTNPLVDIPDQKNPLLHLLESGIESTSSPIGLASLALLPVSGGSSLGLRGALGVGAKLGTRAAAEVAASSAATKAAEVVGSHSKDLPGPLPLLAPLAASVVAGGGVSYAAGGRYLGNSALKALKKADAGISILALPNGVSRLSYTLRNTEMVTGQAASVIAANAPAGSKRFREVLKANKVNMGAYDVAKQSLSKAPKQTRFAPPGVSQPAALRATQYQLTATDIRDIIRTTRRNLSDPIDQVRALATLEDITVRGVKPSGVELQFLRKALGDEFAISLDGLKTKSDVFRQTFFDLLGMPRTLQASIDLSAPLRQGVMLAPNHPIAFAKALGPMVKSFFSEKHAKQVLDDLTLHPSYGSAVENGLEFTGFSGHTFAKSEEQFGNRLLENTLGNTGIGTGVRASERAYSVFLNKLRLDVYHSITKNWQGTPKGTPQNLEAMATMVNNLTGRGKLPGNLGDSQLLSAAFFAPRFLYSRFAAPMQLLTAPKEVKLQVARELTTFVGTGSMVLYLAHKAGMDVEIDPRSTDFGKIRVGNTRYDFWGGYSQIARLVAQEYTGEKKGSDGRVRDVDRSDTLQRFLQTKLAPVPGLGVDIASGTNFSGEEVRADLPTAENQALSRLTPLFLQDIREAIKEDGLQGALRTAPAAFGVGVQTYGTLRETQNLVGGEIFKKPWRDLTPTQQDIVSADPRVLKKQAEFDARPASDYATAVSYATASRLASENQAVAALMAGGTKKDFADAMSQAQLVAKVQRDEAARNFKIDFTPPDSPLQKALDGYYALYDQADGGYQKGFKNYVIDWDLFDQLEADYLKTLTPDQREFVDNRRKSEHAPAADFYFKAKETIANTAYYDQNDVAFTKNKAYVRAIAGKDVTSYSDLVRITNMTEKTDPVLHVRLKKVVSRITSDAAKAKVAMRKKDATLEQALYDAGRVTVFENAILKRKALTKSK